MVANEKQLNGFTSETGARVDAPAEWRSILTAITGALLLFLCISGLIIYILPFGEFIQFNVLIHTVVGLLMVVPVTWYMVRHWWVRRKGKLSHYQLLGYISLAFLAACTISGLVVTYQGVVGPALNAVWDLTHLLTGLGMLVFIVVHLATLIVRKVNNPKSQLVLKSSRHTFYWRTVAGCGLLVVLCGVWAMQYEDPLLQTGFSDDYNWKFGDDQPFSPSLARVENSNWSETVQAEVLASLDDKNKTAYLTAFENVRSEPIGLFAQVNQCTADLDLTKEQRNKIQTALDKGKKQIKNHGALDPRALSGSAGCGTSGCHSEIYAEWLPSAHRYSSMDDMFQKVQEIMAVELSPEHTRYCAGCHDPIALFSGAKDEGNITLSVEGADEGSSCLACHSIVQTDVQGNGDYTIELQQRYVYELKEGPVAKFVSDFLIRTYPEYHTNSFSRSLYKTPEFCAACHKQYIDEIVNTDIGKVQGQNQYDSWKNSKWGTNEDPTKNVTCRECHMPLVASIDPARGDATDYNRSTDDKKHRSHRHLASNQYIPLLHKLEGAKEHTELIEKWLQGKIEVPEIAHKWTDGPVVRMEIFTPVEVKPGEDVSLRIELTNNKTGHEFPTGPLDMIESWVEIIVTDSNDNIIQHTGMLDENDRVVDSQYMLRADVFDRRGAPIDRHNLWDLVGASYKRTLYPGVTDALQIEFQCPSMARGRLRSSVEQGREPHRSEEYVFEAPTENGINELKVEAILWYRKANPEFLDTVYGIEANTRSPIVELTRDSAAIKIIGEVDAASE